MTLTKELPHLSIEDILYGLILIEKCTVCCKYLDIGLVLFQNVQGSNLFSFKGYGTLHAFVMIIW